MMMLNNFLKKHERINALKKMRATKKEDRQRKRTLM